jgi:hypothetical protein
MPEKGLSAYFSCFILEAKFLQENKCLSKSSTARSQTSSPVMHNHKSQHGTQAPQKFRN